MQSSRSKKKWKQMNGPNGSNEITIIYHKSCWHNITIIQKVLIVFKIFNFAVHVRRAIIADNWLQAIASCDLNGWLDSSCLHFHHDLSMTRWPLVEFDTSWSSLIQWMDEIIQKFMRLSKLTISRTVWAELRSRNAEQLLLIHNWTELDVGVWRCCHVSHLIAVLLGCVAIKKTK